MREQVSKTEFIYVSENSSAVTGNLFRTNNKFKRSKKKTLDLAINPIDINTPTLVFLNTREC